MRILIETTVTLADHGEKIRRVEIETAESDREILDPVFIARAILAALDGREDQHVDVGALRVQVCAVAGRLREAIDRADWEDALGMMASKPVTDFAESFRELLRVARVRVTQTDNGNDLLCHDLLVEEPT